MASGDRLRGGATRAEALAAAEAALSAAGIGDARIDAEVMLAGISGTGRADLVAFPGVRLDPGVSRRFAEAVRRRLRREPVAYILGSRGFRRIEVAVDGRVLIPRPESEGLVEVALEFSPSSVLDVGTGSGAIALAVADEIPGCQVVGTDVSEEALEVAASNAVRLGLERRVGFEHGTWPAAGGRFDLVLANLPYVDRDREAAALEPEVREWEPEIALYGGDGGLEVISYLLGSMAGSGVEAGAVALEVGAGQAATVADLVSAAGFGEVSVRPDLAGIERIVVGREPARAD